MNILIRYFIACFILIFSHCAFSDNVKISDFFIPSTLSKEAQSILKTFKREYRVIKDLPGKFDRSGWLELKKKYIGYTQSINKKVVNVYKPTIKAITIAGVPTIEITPSTWKKDDKRLIIYLHGGAFTLFSAKSSLYNSVPLSHISGIRIIAIDYTTAPKKKWKGILDEVTSVILQLYKDGFNPESIGLFGDSAGGGLAVSAVLKLRSKKINLPKVLALWSPWVDLTETGDTYHTLKVSEPTFTYSSLLKHSAVAYADTKDQKNYLVSPVYASFEYGFPSTLIQGGTKELLLSNFVRLYQKMDVANIDVKLDLYEGVWHVFQSHYYLPESKLAIKKTAFFFNSHLINY